MPLWTTACRLTGDRSTWTQIRPTAYLTRRLCQSMGMPTASAWYENEISRAKLTATVWMELLHQRPDEFAGSPLAQKTAVALTDEKVLFVHFFDQKQPVSALYDPDEDQLLYSVCKDEAFYDAIKETISLSIENHQEYVRLFFKTGQQSLSI